METPSTNGNAGLPAPTGGGFSAQYCITGVLAGMMNAEMRAATFAGRRDLWWMLG
jgi:hypothetical protein